MSKKYKGKLCVYCAERPSEDGDHVFSRELFLENKRGDLPKVPACQKCNNEKSKLEHYLAAVLPFGGRHMDALQNLATMVPKRLARNAKLLHSLSAGRDIVELAGTAYTTIPFESERLEQLFSMIAKALLWHHGKTYLNRDVPLESAILPSEVASIYNHLFSVPGTHHWKETLGDDTFSYEGVQQKARPMVSAWRFNIYGGVQLIGDPEAPHETASQLLVVTAIRGALGAL